MDVSITEEMLSFDGKRYHIEVELPNQQTARLSGPDAETLLRTAFDLYQRKLNEIDDTSGEAYKVWRSEIIG